MEQKDKELLLKDLCARLPYGVYLSSPKGNGILHTINLTIFGHEVSINIKATSRDIFRLDECKPYLRPIFSMTKEELSECRATCKNRPIGGSVFDYATSETFDFLNSHHFDYRGLLEKSLALEAPSNMYNIKDK